MIDICNDWKCNICVILWQVFPRWSERFCVGKTKFLCGKFLSDVTHLAKSFISLVFTKSHFFLFAFIWDMVLICILVFNLEFYEYFRPVFVEVFCHSFTRFAKVIFFPMKLFKKIYLHGKFIIELIIEFLFLLSHMFPWMINSLLQKTCSSLVYKNRKAAGLRIVSSKVFKPWIRVVLQRSAVKVLITLLIKQ